MCDAVRRGVVLICLGGGFFFFIFFAAFLCTSAHHLGFSTPWFVRSARLSCLPELPALARHVSFSPDCARVKVLLLSPLLNLIITKNGSLTHDKDRYIGFWQGTIRRELVVGHLSGRKGHPPIYTRL